MAQTAIPSMLRARKLGFEEFRTLLEYRDPAGLAAEALSMLMAHFGATGGSLLYATRPPIKVRKGDLPPALTAYLDQWEANVEQKILAGDWRIGDRAELFWVSRAFQDSDHVLAYSLIVEERSVGGAICVVFSKHEPLANDERAVLASFLQALGGAINLANETAILKERLGQLSLFYQVAQSTASTFDLSKVLNDIMQLATAVIDANAAVLMFVDEETSELVFEYAQGEMGNVLRKQRTALNEGIAGWVATHGVPALVNDARLDERFSPLVDTRTGFLTHSVICVPLQLGGRVIGVLEVLNKRGGQGFDSEDLDLLRTTANQAAIAIERAQLYQSLRDERDRIIKAQEKVRRQVAHNLHDGTVQYLSAISMGINHLEQLVEREPDLVEAELVSLRELTREATRQARLALFELRPVILETQGLVPALDAYVQQLQGSEQFGVHFQTCDRLPELNPYVAATIFSIVQEAVTNVKKHASARDVWLRLSLADDCLQVIVEDNGEGFDLVTVEKSYDQRGSIGLLSMKERAELIEGQMEILSHTLPPNRGTQIVLRVPVQNSAAPDGKIVIR